MSPDSVLGVMALIAAVWLLWSAGTRALSPLAPRGLERTLSVAVVVAASAIGSALVLGLAGLGTGRLALLAAALLAWGITRLLPAAEVRVRDEIAAAWRELDRRARIGAGGAGGLAISWTALSLIEPTLDLDSAYYHLPMVTNWIFGGSPGSIELISTAFPVGSYPLTNEVMLSWIGGISHNLGFTLLWPVLCAAMLASASWLALRTLRCPRPATVLAIAALLLIPVFARSVSSLDTDLASTAWLAVCLALCVRVGASESRPELLGVAIVAFALAVGTKTSVAPLGLAALVAAAALAPRRPRLPVIAASTVISLVVGGAWYLRNWFDHGSPLWPFVHTPGADPLPPSIDGLSVSFLENPIGSIDGRVGQYLGELGAGPLLVVAAVVLGLLCRDRALRLGAAAVAISVLIWAAAPVTGAPEGDALFFTATGVRYLMPTLLLSAGLLALIAGRPGGIGLAARGVLIAAVATGAIDLLVAGDESPSGLALLAGFALGCAAGALLGKRSGSATPHRVIPGVAVPAAALLIALAAYPSAFLSRFHDAGLISGPFEPSLPAIPAMLSYFDALPGFEDDDGGPVRFADTGVIGPVTGGGFEHDVILVRPDDPCAGVAPDSGGWLLAPSSPGSPVAVCIGDLEPETTLGEGSGLEIDVFKLDGSPAEP